ncbi:alpha-L-glutamate ligase-like protein [Kibdelosporangium banguiense]|uniref:Alpha-L-glutamate ligase-like protein n=1 Tax=Kibdelosporangium banguiense TaxID=1365924 RepID=A0ABS4TXY5_9PSEU|nr:sugar-transfer associated ATP-grasp domain-containing protein [Kibdelosporangium banguiense]MBP2329248.1 alpha-L-glutamate ligase-like protein [Kibdelosporangium banguiense]
MTSLLRGRDPIMGMNARNKLIAKVNPKDAIRLVNNKYETKQALVDAGAPTSPTVRLVKSRREINDIDWAEMPDIWAMKPNQGLGGSGIMLAAGRQEPDWQSPSGKPLPRAKIASHLARILDGDFSPRLTDWALFEPLIRTHPALARLSFQGLPDIRVICVRDEPRLAMLRLPTKHSGGRANLHQRAIGAAVDLDTGRVVRACVGSQPIESHPDTGYPLIGAVVPQWTTVLDAASRCAAATGLRYLGADIVVDKTRGPLILEVNARPGLQIQNINGHGLIASIELGEGAPR